MPFTVLHTADWHLGVRLRELDREAEHAAFLAWLLDTADQESADLLVIAGDVFDSAHPPQSALRMWYDFLAALHHRCPLCAVAVVAGNHDSPHVLESASAVLAGMGVFVVGEMPGDAGQCVRVYPDKEGKPALALAAVPFLRDRDLRSGGTDHSAESIQAHLREGIRDCYAAAAAALEPHRRAGLAVMATGHLTVAGSAVSESERDIHVGNLGAVSADIFSAFDSVALGHLHRPQSAGADTVRYSGSPIALSFSEWRDAKEVRALTFENGALLASRSLPIPLSRPLLRLNATSEMLEAEIAALALPTQHPLPTWLEVTVSTTSEPAAVLAGRIRDGLAGRPAELIALRRTASAAAGAPGPARAELHELQPAEVFESLLHTQGLPESERADLLLTFTQLLERHATA